MSKFAELVVTGLLLTGLCLAQSSANAQANATASQDTSVSANQSGARANSNTSTTASQTADVSGKNGQTQAMSASQLQSGSTFQATLTKPVDARKSKVGDEVVAKSTHDVKSEGRVVLPKGSKIVGHVTDVKRRAKGQTESALGIAFDHAILKNGTEIPMMLTIQAISSSEANAAAMADQAEMADESASGMATASGSAATRGVGGGVLSNTGRVVNTAGSATRGTLNTPQTGLGAAGNLTPTSQGVIGMPGLNLSPVASGSTTTAGSVISSNSTNVHLDSGTEMVLRVAGQ